MNPTLLPPCHRFAALVILLGATVARLTASPPASVEDSLYKETVIGGSNVGIEVFHLGAEGVARRLYGVGWGPGTNYVHVYSGSEQLTYAYVPPSVDDPLQATLTFSGGTLTSDRTRMLAFSDADSKSGLFSPFGAFAFRTRTVLTGATNASNRLWLHPGESNITGFFLAEPRVVLVRGIGPTLARFEVAQPAAGTSIGLYEQRTLIASNDQWGLTGPDAQGMGWIFGLVGAFPLEAGSADSALVVELEAGGYTTHVTSDDPAQRGEALLEVYLLPYE